MRVLSAESCLQKSAPTQEPHAASAPRPSTLRDSDVDDDWDPRFYVPTLLVVVAVNVCSLWWLTAHAS